MLELYADYDREAVCNLFAPDQTFTPQAGTWGLHGLVEIPDAPGNYVFFVTFGQSQGEHEFDEGINSLGIVRWQSQPRQGLNDKHVKSWIKHDRDKNAIYLFLRTASKRDGQIIPYTYLGELAYVGHDPKREKPVHFSWQLRNWPIPIHILRHMRLDIEGDDLKSWEQSTPQSLPSTEMNKIAEGVTLLQLRDVRTSGPSKRRFLPRIDINFSKKSEAASELGRLGENLVVTHEKESLKDIGRPDLAEKVVHVAKEKGDGAGYDVLSYFPDGREKFIEVKTTTHGPKTDFFLTANEVLFSSTYPDQYVLYRLYNFDKDRNTADMSVIEGGLKEQLDLTPTEFRVCNLVFE